MEYSIQELSRLSGVTTRTLRWYDKINLLKPSRVAESGYRYYGPSQVDRLQDILYYRALGVGLGRIRECLDDPSFDRLSALRSHLTALETEKARLSRLIQSVRETIETQERNEIMNDEQKFEAFKQRTVDTNERNYGGEIREKYGDAAVDGVHSAVLNLTQEQYEQWMGLSKEIQCRLEEAVKTSKDSSSPEARDITQLHRQWLTLVSNGYEANRHKGIVQLYVMDRRFSDYYDKNVPGCAQFLRDAVCHWADQIEML
ncbi:HTH-type transcriptional activator mta [Eubacteriaceae bacterium CHKCI005]|nr:HTH-type transcriptional activator mta [Eubacteriaceae bacterium CHKCI005]